MDKNDNINDLLESLSEEQQITKEGLEELKIKITTERNNYKKFVEVIDYFKPRVGHRKNN